MAYLQLFGGLIYLLMGGDLLVRGAVALARRTRVPPAIIAVSLVALGTSLPELVVTLQAVLSGYPGMAIGNVVGSNIANVSLVVGVPAIIFPLVVSDDSARRDAAIMVLVSVLFVVLCFASDLGRLQGVALLAGTVAWVGYKARQSAHSQRGADRSAPLEFVLGLPTGRGMIALFMIAGVIGLPLGARMFVEAAAEIAAELGISETIIGLTVVAVGTSLPELTTCGVAAIQRQTDVALGTAIGSNIFNILAIMGTAALISPVAIPIPSAFLGLDLPLMLIGALVLAALVWRGRHVGRPGGLLLVTAYGVYIAALFGLG